MNNSILALVAIVILGLSLAPAIAEAQSHRQATSTKGTASNVRPRTTSKYTNKLTSRKAVAPKQAKARENSDKKESRKANRETAASVIRRNRESARDTRRDGRRLSQNVTRLSKSRHVTFRTESGQRGR